jgi:hypothetical protein
MASCWIFYMNYTMMHGSTNIKFSRQIFEKYFNIKFDKNRPVENEMFRAHRQKDVQINRYDDTNRRISQFC